MDKFQFVIVLYGQTLDNSQSYRSLLKGMKGISLLIYDNSPTAQEIHLLDSSWQVTYLHDSNNSGLSKAYNMGSEIALREGKEFLLLLDQDTMFPDEIMRRYIEAIDENRDIGLFAPILQMNNGLIMSPCRYVAKSGKAISQIKIGLNDLRRYVPVNSGLCIRTSDFCRVGGYNEKVKLDGADFQFIERYKKLSTDFVVINAICQQDFSAFDRDIDRVLRRFYLYQQDVKNYEYHKFLDRFYHGKNLLKRMVFLSLQHKSFRFFKQYLRNL